MTTLLPVNRGANETLKVKVGENRHSFFFFKVVAVLHHACMPVIRWSYFILSCPLFHNVRHQHILKRGDYLIYLSLMKKSITAQRKKLKIAVGEAHSSSVSSLPSETEANSAVITDNSAFIPFFTSLSQS